MEPHVLCKYAFKIPTKKYYIRNYLYIAVFAVSLVALNFCLQSYESQWKELLVNGSIAVAIAIVPSTIIILIDKDFRHYMSVTLNKIKNRIKRKKSQTEDVNK